MWAYQIDVQFMVIRLFEVLGLASDVVVAPPSKLRAGYSSEGLLTSVACEVTLSLLVVLVLWSAPHWAARWLCSCMAPRAKPTKLAEEAAPLTECRT